MAEQTRMMMTAEEFEALPEQTTPVELIEGELVMRGAPKIKHQRLVFNLAILLREIIPDGEVFIAPVSVKFNDRNYYQPDVLWVSANNTVCAIMDDGLNGAPDLVVEVISEGTARVDRGIKFDTYQDSGVREYWIVETDHNFIEVWQLVDDVYKKHGLYEAKQSFISPALGVDVSLDGIFEESE